MLWFKSSENTVTIIQVIQVIQVMPAHLWDAFQFFCLKLYISSPTFSGHVRHALPHDALLQLRHPSHVWTWPQGCTSDQYCNKCTSMIQFIEQLVIILLILQNRLAISCWVIFVDPNSSTENHFLTFTPFKNYLENKHQNWKMMLP